MCFYILNPISFILKDVWGSEQNDFSYFSNDATEIWFSDFLAAS